MVKRAIHIIHIESQVDRLNDYDCRVCMRPLMCVKQLSAAESHWMYFIAFSAMNVWGVFTIHTHKFIHVPIGCHIHRATVLYSNSVKRRVIYIMRQIFRYVNATYDTVTVHSLRNAGKWKIANFVTDSSDNWTNGNNIILDVWLQQHHVDGVQGMHKLWWCFLNINSLYQPAIRSSIQLNSILIWKASKRTRHFIRIPKTQILLQFIISTWPA